MNANCWAAQPHQQPCALAAMAVVAVDDELVALLVDGARYGDMEDVDAAFSQHVPVDSKDGAGRTGKPGQGSAAWARGCCQSGCCCSSCDAAAAGPGSRPAPTRTIRPAPPRSHRSTTHGMCQRSRRSHTKAAGCWSGECCRAVSGGSHAVDTARQGLMPPLLYVSACACTQATTVQNEQGNTPLHWACLNGHIEVSRLAGSRGEGKRCTVGEGSARPRPLSPAPAPTPPPPPHAVITSPSADGLPPTGRAAAPGQRSQRGRVKPVSRVRPAHTAWRVGWGWVGGGVSWSNVSGVAP